MLTQTQSEESCCEEDTADSHSRGGGRPSAVCWLRAVFHSERDFELISCSVSSVQMQQNIDLVLLSAVAGE